MKKGTQRNQHTRTRDDHATETTEDYVEAIAEITDNAGVCRGVDLARHFEVSNVTVNKTINRLQRDGYAVTKPYGPVSLTAKGRKLAAECRRRHKIVYQFLLALGVDEQTARVDSEGIEHHVSPSTLSLMENFASKR